MSVNVSKDILNDPTKTVKAGELITSGIPLTISAAVDAFIGQLKLPVGTSKIYGIALFDQNAYRNQVTDTTGGLYGSGKGTVEIQGIVEVGRTVYHAPDGTPTNVDVYDTSKTYAYLEKVGIAVVALPLPVGNVPLISNNPDNTASIFGIVVGIPTDASLGTPLQILLIPNNA